MSDVPAVRVWWECMESRGLCVQEPEGQQPDEPARGCVRCPDELDDPVSDVPSVRVWWDCLEGVGCVCRDLWDNALTSLPEGVFDGLTSLTEL